LKFCWFLLLSSLVSFLYYYPCVSLPPLCYSRAFSVFTVPSLYIGAVHLDIIHYHSLFLSHIPKSCKQFHYIYIHACIWSNIYLCTYLSLSFMSKFNIWGRTSFVLLNLVYFVNMRILSSIYLPAKVILSFFFISEYCIVYIYWSLNSGLHIC
jgi:hypothetical protein